MKPTRFLSSLALLLGLGLLAACEPSSEPRVYNAPKEDTVFVVQPPAAQSPFASAPFASGGGGMPAMASSNSVPLSQRRILGAIFPYKSAGYFLKITDSVERVEPIAPLFPSVVAAFKTDDAGKVDFPLPEGWTVQAGDAFALAKVSIPVPGSDKPVVMTISELVAPQDEKAWPDYVLLQMNRWNGQVGHDEQNLEDMMASLKPVERDGAASPAYLFDKNGSHTGENTGSSPAQSDATQNAAVDGNATVVNPAGAVPNDAIHAGMATHGSSDSAASGGFDATKVTYDVPDGWAMLEPTMFRLATFKIAGVDGDVDGEVVLSQAIDNPIENSKMWSEQVLKTDDPAVLEPKSEEIVAAAETIPAGEREAKLYSIRSNEDPNSIVLEIAVVPVGQQEMALFVKLRSSLKMAEQQKSNLLRFVNSLRWE